MNFIIFFDLILLVLPFFFAFSLFSFSNLESFSMDEDGNPSSPAKVSYGFGKCKSLNGDDMPEGLDSLTERTSNGSRTVTRVGKVASSIAGQAAAESLGFDPKSHSGDFVRRVTEAGLSKKSAAANAAASSSTPCFVSEITFSQSAEEEIARNNLKRK